jgi:hypothetical protein|tara:strand:+ start:883 stop:1572 length:690 start_codon:yes stop_codon:yes gene_type:complete
MKNRIQKHFSSGETGRMLELDYLYPANDPRRRVVDKIDGDAIQYKSLAQSILESIEENPARYEGSELWDPPAGWLNDVHYAIVDELGLDDWKCLTVMPTLKTAADRYHGIDFLVIYRDPATEREVIVSVDLSLRQKEEFKADVLITDTGAKPNEDYYFTSGQNVPDVQHATKEEDEMVRHERRRATGKVIAEIIEEKLKGEDPHYGGTMRKISKRLHNDVEGLLNADAA